MEKGTIFNIQKLSIHDGPGIRTTVFFKGCPLNCLWCSNPESQAPGLEIGCFNSRCINCGYCAEICPKGIIEKQAPYSIADRERCDLCGICVKECCTEAKKVVGEEYDLEGLLNEIEKDRTFYESSGGGVTFSGGEPFMQSEFLINLLKMCKESGLHTAIETTAMTAEETLLEACRYLDLIYVDIKHMDSDKHKELTAVPNEKILSNIAAMSRVHNNIIARIPVIPGINDEESNIRATAEFVAGLGIGTLELLPYHNLGEVKYSQLGREYKLAGTQRPDEQRMAEVAQIAEEVIAGRPTEVSIMKSI